MYLLFLHFFDYSTPSMLNTALICPINYSPTLQLSLSPSWPWPCLRTCLSGRHSASGMETRFRLKCCKCWRVILQETLIAFSIEHGVMKNLCQDCAVYIVGEEVSGYALVQAMIRWELQKSDSGLHNSKSSNHPPPVGWSADRSTRWINCGVRRIAVALPSYHLLHYDSLLP